MDIYRLFKRGEQIAISKARRPSRFALFMAKRCQRGQLADGGRAKGGVRVWSVSPLQARTDAYTAVLVAAG
jgi:hypothetical protein